MKNIKELGSDKTFDPTRKIIGNYDDEVKIQVDKAKSIQMPNPVKALKAKR